MNKKTAAALDKSIAHWNRHATGTAGEGETASGDDCALCAIFAKPFRRNTYCDGCPVMASTGFSGCKRTPWGAANREWYRIEEKEPNARPGRFRKAAARERDFLISLRDKP